MDNTQRLRFLFIFMIVTSPFSSCLGQKFEDINPPYWFAGMPNDTLEILIHQTNIGLNTTEIITNNSGIELLEVVHLENKNYIILQVGIDKNASDQSFKIRSKGKAGKFQISYEIKSRQAHLRGLDQSDIIYLITPDRFANGDLSNDSFSDMNQVGVNRDEPYERHGGDIRGIIDHIDYIDSLGMTTIWPNPLLENDQGYESYHGYAMTDLYTIDKRFGSNADYLELISKLHARDMKIIQDVVYNHIGNEHFLFKDCPDSSWFNFWDSFTRTNYRAPTLMDPYAAESDKRIMTDAWFDKHMPDLNQRNQHVARYLIQQTLWWIEAYQIDALRIDTYAYPDQEFMRDWAHEVKAAFPDIFIFAETWVHGPTVQAWFVGEGLAPIPNGIDAVTDFQLYYAINDALTKDQGWADGLSKIYYTLSADYIYERPQDLVTFVDNHDLARFLGYMNGDLRKYKIGLTWLFTLRGIPSIYYGTETLMKATDGHGHIREDFLGGWPSDSLNHFNPSERDTAVSEAHAYIQLLSKLRKTEAAFQNGSLVHFVPVDGVYVYFRKSDEKAFMVIANCTNDAAEHSLSRYQAEFGAFMKASRMDGSSIDLDSTVSLPAMSIDILELK